MHEGGRIITGRVNKRCWGTSKQTKRGWSGECKRAPASQAGPRTRQRGKRSLALRRQRPNSSNRTGRTSIQTPTNLSLALAPIGAKMGTLRLKILLVGGAARAARAIGGDNGGGVVATGTQMRKGHNGNPIPLRQTMDRGDGVAE